MLRLATFLFGMTIEAGVWLYLVFVGIRRPYCLGVVGANGGGSTPCSIPQAAWDSYHGAVVFTDAIVVLGIGLMVLALVGPRMPNVIQGRRAIG
jgi:hypothetical protein